MAKINWINTGGGDFARPNWNAGTVPVSSEI
jgi:hypothetical protein